jgi:hypothetical protein
MRAFILALVLAFGSLTAVALTPTPARAQYWQGTVSTYPVYWRGYWGPRYYGSYYYGYPGYYYSYPSYSYGYYGYPSSYYGNYGYPSYSYGYYPGRYYYNYYWRY